MLQFNLFWIGLLILIISWPESCNAEQPNILFCISDDQSYAHTSANGDPVVRTPAFDRVAREGLRFTHAFCDAPTCGPSRSAILTGQEIWRLEEGGNIHSTLPAKFKTYTELLQDSGYAVGFTGKGWGPGRLQPGGRRENPAGQEYLGSTLQPAYRFINNRDYAANFEQFLSELTEDQPFCFWLGTSEPHRPFQSGVGVKTGKDLRQVNVPAIFPDNEIVRNDLLDYLVEIEHFDSMVARAIAALEKADLLDKTIVVVTSDHGMPFPRAKATLYDDGTRVPLAIRWPGGISNPGRIVEQPVNLSDLTPTFLEAAAVAVPQSMTAESLIGMFTDQPVERSAAFIALERHDGCRAGGKGYPCRAIRTKDYLYIHNFQPDRWPSGSPDPGDCARSIPFGEIDTSPTKKFLMQKRAQANIAPLAELAFGRRPAVEFYDVREDPHTMRNLAGRPDLKDVEESHRKNLFEHLRATQDPRVSGGPILWDHYPYYGKTTTPGWQVAPPKDE
ncbi:MAG: sulfatase [Planctomycetota bacterium]|nr:sulfatase [Planctomycetota bacterium]